MQYTLDRLGPHGLPLIGRADWNDCLNLNCFSATPGESFQTTTNQDGVSRRIGLHRRAVCPRGRRDGADRRVDGQHAEASGSYRADAATMAAAVDAAGWDGAWFRRAYDNFGRPVGSHWNARRPDLHRAAGHVRHGRASAWTTAAPAGPGLGARAAGDAARHRPAAACLLRVLPAPGRNLVLSAGLQGERRHLLPHQPVDHDRRGEAGQRRRGATTTTCASTRRPGRRSATSTAASRTCTPR